jgi:hypothetical protein
VWALPSHRSRRAKGRVVVAAALGSGAADRPPSRRRGRPGLPLGRGDLPACDDGDLRGR